MEHGLPCYSCGDCVYGFNEAVFYTKYLFWSEYKTRLSYLLDRKWNGGWLRAGVGRHLGKGRQEELKYSGPDPVSLFQVILEGIETKRRRWQCHCVKRLLYLSDAELVTNPQEGCCYCLGVGEACWKKSVVWGNVKQVCLVLIRREGILSWLKILPKHHWELNALSRRTLVAQPRRQQIYKQQLQGSAGGSGGGDRLRGHLWLLPLFYMHFPSLNLISWG